MNINLPLLGDILLLNAAILGGASATLYALVWRGKSQFHTPARIVFWGASAALTAACVTLMSLVLNHDYSVNYVFSYSSNDLPLHFLFSSFWAGQEGTFLLWMFYLAVMGLILMRTAKHYEAGGMFFLNLIILSLLIIVLKKSPFETSSVFRLDGQGLNPLLQDYWMVIHPPTMFIGFAGTAIPFVFALTALVQKSFGDWYERSRRWTLVAWLALGIALIEGGFWAYKVLGWGGFWAWDPVENTSFIPWIFLTAQIHTNFIRRKRNALPRFGLMMVCLTFLATLYGTFLTRSGVLADFSVHSFVDLGINNFLLGGLFFFLFLTIVLFTWRWQAIPTERAFHTVASRSYLVTLGIVILFLGGILTLLGTSAPLLTKLVTQPAAVDISYYKGTMNPIAVVILILLTLFPTFKWDSGFQKLWSLAVALCLAAITFIALYWGWELTNIMYCAIGAFGVSALWSNGFLFISKSSRQHIAGQYLMHSGVALLLIGATMSAGHERKEKVDMPLGEEVSALGYNLTYTGSVRQGSEESHNISFRDSDGDSFSGAMHSQYQERDGAIMNSPHIERFALYDLYMSPLSVERFQANDPGLVELEKDSSASIGPYTVSFHGFDLAGSDSVGAATSAAARLVIRGPSGIDTVAPYLQIFGVGDSVSPVGASFFDSAGNVFIADVKTETGAVVLKFFGDFVPEPAAPPTPHLVAEVTIKPLINLFWLGSILVFLGAGIVIFRRVRGADKIGDGESVATQQLQAATPVRL